MKITEEQLREFIINSARDYIKVKIAVRAEAASYIAGTELLLPLLLEALDALDQIIIGQDIAEIDRGNSFGVLECKSISNETVKSISEKIGSK